MKSAIFVALALLSGCGYRSGGHYSYPEPQPQPIPSQPGLSAFVIDAGAGVVADPNTYGITTDGVVWRLTFLGDAYVRNFRGSISCPPGCRVNYARYDGTYPGDTVVVGNGQVTFNAQTDAAVPETIDLSFDTQPIVYDLFIDGQEAIGAVVFQSGGIRSTTDDMPFGLYSSNSGLKVEDKTQLAPQFISQLPKDQASQAIKVSAPEPGLAAQGSSGVVVKQ